MKGPDDLPMLQPTWIKSQQPGRVACATSSVFMRTKASEMDIAFPCRADGLIERELPLHLRAFHLLGMREFTRASSGTSVDLGVLYLTARCHRAKGDVFASFELTTT